MGEIRRFVIANDHAGVEVKEAIIKHLEDTCQIIDIGANDENVKVDYPLYAFKAVEMALDLNCECILICGSGEGMCICANKIIGARACLLYNENVAKLAKEHNDANVICFGAREFSVEKILRMLDIFIKSKFTDERHLNRIEKINNFERKSKIKK